MSKSSKAAARAASGCIEIKSKFDAEYRRFGLSRKKLPQFDEFLRLVEQIHRLTALGSTFCLWYTDPEGDLLPITNDDNFAKALTTAWPLLRVHVQRKGQFTAELTGYGTAGRRPKGMLIGGAKPHPHIAIGLPEDFRRVSAIIDVDVIPENHRRVRLMKNGQDKPLGFYIRDGTSIRVTTHGLEKVPGIFISRLVPGGLAESTGLLAINDEVLEVNGIEVAGKTLDQVTDMMVANSANLIVTVKPVNQHNNISPRRGGSGRSGGSEGGAHGGVRGRGPAPPAAPSPQQQGSSTRSSQKSLRSGRSLDSLEEVGVARGGGGEGGGGGGDSGAGEDDEDMVQDHTLVEGESGAGMGGRGGLEGRDGRDSSRSSGRKPVAAL